MRLEPLAVYVLNCFRTRRTDSLPFSDIAQDCTIRRRAALRDALERLREQRLLTGIEPELITLTEEGRSYLALAEAESTEHFQP